MTGRVTVDGIDLYQEWGIFVAERGYDNLVSLPSLKEPTKTDWNELDGIDVDLTSPVLDSRNLTITFGFNAMDGRQQYAFISYLASAPYHLFDFVEIQRAYTLRFTGQSDISQIDNVGLISVKFSDDYPVRTFTPLILPSILPAGRYVIGNIVHGYHSSVTLETFGIQVLEGTINSIRKSPDTKKTLMYSSKYEAGTECQTNGHQSFLQKELVIKCLMRAQTLSLLWKQYDTMLMLLTSAGVKTIEDTIDEEVYHAYYSGCTVTEFLKSGIPWLEFDLKFKTTDFRPTGAPYNIYTEDDFVLVDEIEESPFIIYQNH